VARKAINIHSKIIAYARTTAINTRVDTSFAACPTVLTIAG